MTPIFGIGVLAAAVAAMIIGMIWYGIFGNYWMGLIGKTKEELHQTPTMYLITFMGAMATALVLSLIVGLTGSSTAAGGAVVGLLVAIGFIATSMGNNYLFEGRPSRLFGLNVGFHLVNLIIMGAIVGAIH